MPFLSPYGSMLLCAALLMGNLPRAVPAAPLRRAPDVRHWSYQALSLPMTLEHRSAVFPKAWMLMKPLMPPDALPRLAITAGFTTLAWLLDDPGLADGALMAMMSPPEHAEAKLLKFLNNTNREAFIRFATEQSNLSKTTAVNLWRHIGNNLFGSMDELKAALPFDSPNKVLGFLLNPFRITAEPRAQRSRTPAPTERDVRNTPPARVIPLPSMPDPDRTLRQAPPVSPLRRPASPKWTNRLRKSFLSELPELHAQILRQHVLSFRELPATSQPAAARQLAALNAHGAALAYLDWSSGRSEEELVLWRALANSSTELPLLTVLLAELIRQRMIHAPGLSRVIVPRTGLKGIPIRLLQDSGRLGQASPLPNSVQWRIYELNAAAWDRPFPVVFDEPLHIRFPWLAPGLKRQSTTLLKRAPKTGEAATGRFPDFTEKPGMPSPNAETTWEDDPKAPAVERFVRLVQRWLNGRPDGLKTELPEFSVQDVRPDLHGALKDYLSDADPQGLVHLSDRGKRFISILFGEFRTLEAILLVLALPSFLQGGHLPSPGEAQTKMAWSIMAAA